MSSQVQQGWHLLNDDVWICLMASYWRLTSAIERKVHEETSGMPDWIASDTAKEIRETAYLEERRIWGAGMDRLCELYEVPEAPPMAQQSLMENAEHCKSCGAEIWWSISTKGKPVPMSKATGVTHFADCPHAKTWSKGKRVPA